MTMDYVSCSCNRVPHCADWGKNGLICFGTCNAVGIYNPCTYIGRITHTLHHHRDRVNTVQWIKPGEDIYETELLSGSVDGTVIIWSKDSVGNSFRHTSVLDVESIVNFVDTLQLPTVSSSAVFSNLLICVGSMNGKLTLYVREKDANIRLIQTLTYKKKLPMYCRLTYLPGTKFPLLALTVDDASILLYTSNFTTAQPTFLKVMSLYGHKDWVKCMDFISDSEGNILFATGSQDSTIRLWKISSPDAKKSNIEFSKKQIVQRNKTFVAYDKNYEITLESVLCGHEGWVYGVHWEPTNEKNDNNSQSRRLLSSSLDKSMIIWEMDDFTGIWTEKVRVGKVGGNSLGFYGCKFGPDGLHILGHDYQGSFHIWKYMKSTANWVPQFAPNGHFCQVVDLCWEPKGRFLITAGVDQTTRIHVPWKNDDAEELWHEIARPQIHGYDMTCLVMLAPFMYASGAEEKVVRVFAATSAFKNHLKLLTNVEDFKCIAGNSATVPSLGLTNKATYDQEKNHDDNVDGMNSISNIYKPLTEEELGQNTLWPELQKLYGHGYEIFCMSARYDGQLLATACKSTTTEHSAIILWNTTTWSQVQQLVSHNLTVTQMEFSPNDKYLLSVSRDRRWSLFKDIDGIYTLIKASSKLDNSHTRIIWCCTWTHDSNYFATGSREGKVCVWLTKSIEHATVKLIPETTFNSCNNAVTALCFAPSCITKESYILAIGYEAGCIEIQKLTINIEKVTWSKLLVFDTSQAHHLTVKRLKFRPIDIHSSNTLQLASCGSDYAVKIYNLKLSS